MIFPKYLDLKGARKTLSEIGLELSERQIKRAAEPNASGRRKLPFFIDPIDKRLKIEKGTLLEVYNTCQSDAIDNALLNNQNLNFLFDEKR